jgi:hypothetical protein
MEAWSGSVQVIGTQRHIFIILTLFTEAVSTSEVLCLQSLHDVD